MAEPATPPPRAVRKRIRSPFVRRAGGDGSGRFGVDLTALKDLLITVGPALLLVLGAFWIAAKYVRPAPPTTFVMTTGAEGGAYHLFAQRYRDILAREGVTVQLRPSQGSLENLRRLRDGTGEVEVGLVQGGIQPPDGHTLQTLGTVFHEPLWVFYRARTALSRPNDLKGLRIAVGADGSGTQVLALQLLRAAGAADGSKLVELGGPSAAEALERGEVDAVFVVGSPDAPIVQRLVKAKDVRLMSIANADAWSRRFSHLSVLKLPRGVVDLAADLPREDVTLLATTASIVIREDFHPALAFLLLYAAVEVHGRAGVLQGAGEFPAARESDFPLSDEARRYFKSGPPFLQRYLPFWVASFIERMLVLLIPLVAVVVPVVKFLPAVYEWRVKNRLFRWYAELRALEAEVESAPDPDRVDAYLDRLDVIERAVEDTRVPLGYADYAYHLRGHVDVVRRHIERICAGSAGADPSS